MDLPFRSAVVSWRETSYVRIKKLGEGGASSVNAMLATSGFSKGKLFAVKFFDALDKPVRWRLDFMKEIHFLRSCSHPGIITVHDEGVHEAGCDTQHPFVVMEMMQGNLADLMRKPESLSETKKIGIVVQLLSALNYLSRLDPPGVHRDIKPKNILFQGHNCVLGDFGLVSLLHSNSKPSNWEKPKAMPMAAMYRTPELVAFAKYGSPLPPASDVFQLGLVAAELFSGANPLDPSGGMDRVELRAMEPISGRHSEAITALIQPMLERDFRKRVTAGHALASWQELYLKSFERSDRPMTPFNSGAGD